MAAAKTEREEREREEREREREERERERLITHTNKYGERVRGGHSRSFERKSFEIGSIRQKRERKRERHDKGERQRESFESGEEGKYSEREVKRNRKKRESERKDCSIGASTTRVNGVGKTGVVRMDEGQFRVLRRGPEGKGCFASFDLSKSSLLVCLECGMPSHLLSPGSYIYRHYSNANHQASDIPSNTVCEAWVQQQLTGIEPQARQHATGILLSPQIVRGY